MDHEASKIALPLRAERCTVMTFDSMDYSVVQQALGNRDAHYRPSG